MTKLKIYPESFAVVKCVIGCTLTKIQIIDNVTLPAKSATN